jgi:hypothetical protein
MRFRRLLAAAAVAVSLNGCLATHHVDHYWTSHSSSDANGNPTSEVEVTHNERHWLGPWPVQPWRTDP